MGCKILVPEDFIGGVMVVELRQVGRQVRYQIFIVNYPVNVLDFVVYVLCEIDVTDPRGTK